MSTEIRTWQILQGKLIPLESALKDEGRTEPYDLEPWIESMPEIVASDMLVIGRQVQTKSGPIDLLAIDRSGNIVVIELKRDDLPREVLAQAIDKPRTCRGGLSSVSGRSVLRTLVSL